MQEVMRTIGYLHQLVQDGEAPWIAYLSVDEHGLPVEFLHCDPRAITDSVRAFHGLALDRHIRKQSIQSIAHALERPPDIVLCCDTELVRVATPDFPIIRVDRATGLPPQDSGAAVTSAFAERWPLLKELDETTDWDLYEPFDRFDRIRQELLSVS